MRCSLSCSQDVAQLLEEKQDLADFYSAQSSSRRSAKSYVQCAHCRERTHVRLRVNRWDSQVGPLDCRCATEKKGVGAPQSSRYCDVQHAHQLVVLVVVTSNVLAECGC